MEGGATGRTLEAAVLHVEGGDRSKLRPALPLLLNMEETIVLGANLRDMLTAILGAVSAPAASFPALMARSVSPQAGCVTEIGIVRMAVMRVVVVRIR